MSHNDHGLVKNERGDVLYIVHNERRVESAFGRRFAINNNQDVA